MEFLFAAANLVALGTLAFAWFAKSQDPLSPGGIQAAIWTFIIFLYLFLPHGLYPLSLRTSLIVLSGAVLFSLGVLAAGGAAALNPEYSPGLTAGYRASETVRFIAAWLPVVALPFVVRRAVQIAELTPVTDSMYVNLRYALTEEGMGHTPVGFGPLSYVTPLCHTSVMIELVCSRRRFFEPRGWLVFVVSIVYGIISTGRTYFLLILLGVTGILVATGRVRATKLAPVAGMAVLAVYFAIGSALDKLSLGSAFGDESVEGTVHTFGVYMLGGLAAFDQVSGRLESFSLSFDHTFRTFYAVLSSLGFNVEVVRKVKEYVYIPEPTNVYSVFYPYANDFGVIGGVLCLFPLGALHGFLHRRAQHGDPRYMILSAFSLYPLAMQFFQDQYLSLLTVWVIQAGIVFVAIRPQGREEA